MYIVVCLFVQLGVGNDEQNKCNEFAIMAKILHPAPALIKHGGTS